MNIYKGLDHQVKVFSGKDGQPLKSRKPKRPEGMSGRQWKKFRKAARRIHSARTVATAEQAAA